MLTLITSKSNNSEYLLYNGIKIYQGNYGDLLLFHKIHNRDQGMGLTRPGSKPEREELLKNLKKEALQLFESLFETGIEETHKNDTLPMLLYDKYLFIQYSDDVEKKGLPGSIYELISPAMAFTGRFSLIKDDVFFRLFELCKSTSDYSQLNFVYDLYEENEVSEDYDGSVIILNNSRKKIDNSIINKAAHILFALEDAEAELFDIIGTFLSKHNIFGGIENIERHSHMTCTFFNVMCIDLSALVYDFLWPDPDEYEGNINSSVSSLLSHLCLNGYNDDDICLKDFSNYLRAQHKKKSEEKAEIDSEEQTEIGHAIGDLANLIRIVEGEKYDDLFDSNGVCISNPFIHMNDSPLYFFYRGYKTSLHDMVTRYYFYEIDNCCSDFLNEPSDLINALYREFKDYLKSKFGSDYSMWSSPYLNYLAALVDREYGNLKIKECAKCKKFFIRKYNNQKLCSDCSKERQDQYNHEAYRMKNQPITTMINRARKNMENSFEQGNRKILKIRSKGKKWYNEPDGIKAYERLLYITYYNFFYLEHRKKVREYLAQFITPEYLAEHKKDIETSLKDNIAELFPCRYGADYKIPIIKDDKLIILPDFDPAIIFQLFETAKINNENPWSKITKYTNDLRICSKLIKNPDPIICKVIDYLTEDLEYTR